ncbi:hypothetical protein RQN30_11950 [Arcanobacterium hippocoleae]
MYRVFTASEIKNFYKYLVGFTVNKIYRREYLQQAQIDFPEVGAHEDMPFTYLALSAAARIYYLPKTFYHYRRFRSGSLSDATEKHYEYMLEALFELKKVCNPWVYGIFTKRTTPAMYSICAPGKIQR